MIIENKTNDRILELKKKIQQEDYLDEAILEIASLLTESIDKGQFILHERKQFGSTEQGKKTLQA